MRTVGVGTRVIDFLIDTTLVFLISYLLNKVNNFYQFYWRFSGVSGTIIFCVVLVLYYVVSEGIFGNSLGKKASISKVVNQQNQKPSFLQILLRSIVRLFPLDFILIPFTERTLHDIVSKTYVVER